LENGSAGIEMKEIDVAATDFLLSAESFTFFFLISKREDGTLKGPFLVLFLASGLSAAIGGIFHGFVEPATRLGALLWWLTLLAIGLTSYGFALVGAKLAFVEKWVSTFKTLLTALCAAYLVCTIFIREFLVAILFYVPATLLALYGFVHSYRKFGGWRLFAGFTGVGISLVAPVIQQLKFSLPSLHLTHNAVYHVVLMIALALFFVGAGGVLHETD
jgi:hypothetical protein